MTGSPGDNARNAELLDDELADPRFADDAYLHWLYDLNPYGPAWQRGVDDEAGTRIGHYALIPQEYRDASGPAPVVFSLNAVVRSGTQRAGLFTRMGLELYEEAAGAGRRFATGVCNDKSIGAVVKYMGWRTLGPLPVRVVLPAAMRTGDVEHHPCTPSFLASPELERLAGDLDDAPARGWTNRWTVDHLRWRLARPHAAMVLHLSDDLAAVTVATRAGGLPTTAVLKLLPRGGRPGPHSPRRIIAAACRYHHTPVAVYAGFNAHVPVHGITPPLRFRPSPLHLIVRHLAADFDQDAAVLDTFEFLDMDAY